jgi:mannosyltransferase OCH1-like enzyme
VKRRGSGPITRGSLFEPIPRVIHQTWKSTALPECWQPYQRSWRTAHPDWSYRLWTDADNRQLIANRYNWFLATYDRFPRDIQRVDAAKYFILHAFGGVYADLDCECVRSLESIVETGGLIVGRTSDGVIDGAVLASPPGHPFWPQVFRRIHSTPWQARALRGWFDSAYVLMSTGPQMLRRAVRDYLRTADGSAGGGGVTVCPPETFSSRSWLARYEPFPASHTFVKHHYADSWLGPGETQVLRWFTRDTLRWGIALLALSLAALAASLWSGRTG